MSAQKMVSRWCVGVAACGLALAALPYAPDAEARGRRAGFFVGGVVVGAMLAPRYVYPAPYYYYPAPAVIYPAYPPAVTYVSPPVVVPPVVVQQQAAPVVPQAAARAQPLSIEDRLHRLRSVCDQGLFTESECQSRREQILQEM
jgi:hypothetical protein